MTSIEKQDFPQNSETDSGYLLHILSVIILTAIGIICLIREKVFTQVSSSAELHDVTYSTIQLSTVVFLLVIVLCSYLAWRIYQQMLRSDYSAQQMSKKLQWQASHDALTGLTNRNAFEKKILDAMHLSQEDETVHALLYLDLDRFKIVNDTCGHIAGDELLSQLCYVLKQHLEDTNELARLGGDEFGVLLYNCSEETALGKAEEMIQAAEAFRFSWEGKFFSVGISIGMVMINQNSNSVRDLLSHADIACYSAKDNGRGCVMKYDKHTSKSYQEMSISVQIKQALENNSFILYHQKIDCLNPDLDKTSASEILLRMKAGEDTLVPGVFLSIAERFDMMKSIDRWVIENTFDFINTNRRALRKKKHRFSINLSGETINDSDFYDYLSRVIKRYKIDTRLLCFEITETIAIRNLHKAAYLIGAVKRLGCTIALDDFGTGTSSFAYLKYLPIDYLKIDGTFIKDISHDIIDYEIVNAISNICAAMEIKVVAEYVEDKKTIEALKALKIDYVQGYAIHKPITLSMETFEW